MPSVRQLRRRIRSVENTSKITKAMSMIAASKMRRAQEAALQGRPYAEKMRGLLANLASGSTDDEDTLNPLLRRREANKIQLVVITPDRGLTGGLNSNINRAAAQFILRRNGGGGEISAIAVGRKARDFLVRSRQNVKAVFTDIGDRPSITDLIPIIRLVTEQYANEETDATYLVYAQFVNTTVQRPIVEPLLPVTPPDGEGHEAIDYIYEPSQAQVLDALLPRYLEMQIYHAVLEGIASEQSARMVAMRNATDNANAMVEDLTLVMNKARQESITTELLDIVGGAAAVEG